MLDSAVALPTIYVCAVIFGFMLNTCTNKAEVQRLTDQVDNLEWELSFIRYKLENNQTKTDD
jgi:hypothetical protein